MFQRIMNHSQKKRTRQVHPFYATIRARAFSPWIHINCTVNHEFSLSVQLFAYARTQPTHAHVELEEDMNKVGKEHECLILAMRREDIHSSWDLK